MIPEGEQICQLFGWTRFNAPNPLCTELGADEDIDIRHQAPRYYLSNKSSSTKRSSTEDQTSVLHHPSQRNSKWKNSHGENTNQMPPFNNYQIPPPHIPPPQQPFCYNPNPGYNPSNQSIPIKKLMHTSMGLDNIQEQLIKQQEHIQQRNIDNQHTIHYTIQNAMKQLSTTYAFTPATNLTLIALEMLVSKKRDNALNFLLLSLNDRGVCAQITPQNS